MATNNQNLFEKYGIKEVADVTFYRIEKKEETYESQREISVASILKGAIKVQKVYPLVNGIGSDEGFSAFVFTDADILTRTNYDCDDSNSIVANYRTTFESSSRKTETEINDIINTGVNKINLVKWALGKGNSVSGFTLPEALSYIDESSNSELTISKVKAFDTFTSSDDATATIIQEQPIYKTYKVGVAVAVNNTGTGTFTLTPDAGCEIVEVTPAVSTVITKDANTYEYTAAAEGSETLTIKFKHSNGDTVVSKNIKITVSDDNGTLKIASNFNKVSSNFRIIDKYSYILGVIISFDAENSVDKQTGIYDTEDVYVPDSNYDGAGTHEYDYAQQVCLLFSRKQNLISKTGSRFKFNSVDTIFGDIDFNDNFASAPFSSEKIVVVGLSGKFTDGTYNVEEVEEYIKQLTNTYRAKAYDTVYNDYAELVVEDEMGFYRSDFLGYEYTKNGITGEAIVDFFDGNNTYSDWIENQGLLKDTAIANATMWEDGIHYSINDAIDALRQKQETLDIGEAGGINGLKSIFGGYKVSSKNADQTATPDAGAEDADDIYPDNKYEYSFGGLSDENIISKYPLKDVKDAINTITLMPGVYEKNVRVDAGTTSNRAIYIKVDNSVTAAGAYIYLLHNKNYRKLFADKDGVFQFEDKKGNTLYYQDKIFCGVEWLALVIVGNKGLIFVVNRHGDNDTTKVAWMVNESGYIDNKKAEILVKNGLIHTTDITVNNETFEATCSVKSLKIRKINKKTNHYIPVLFLDTLKVSTIEQTAETTYATGGRGNANLIGWDFGKEITLNLQDALFTPASMSAIFGSYDGSDFRKGVKEVKGLDRFEKVTAKRSFIVPAGNSNGTPTEADRTAQAVFYDPNTMEPYADGTPIAEGEIFYKFTRSVAYKGQSLGHMIEISADKFPGTYKVVGDTFVRSKETGEDERFQFVIPQAKMTSEQTITLEADGEPAVNIFLNAAVKIA